MPRFVFRKLMVTYSYQIRMRLGLFLAEPACQIAADDSGLPTTSDHPAAIVRDDVRARLDILLEAGYRHLECLLKKSASAPNCCKGRWTC
jgi:hypothetical protein